MDFGFDLLSHWRIDRIDSSQLRLLVWDIGKKCSARVLNGSALMAASEGAGTSGAAVTEYLSHSTLLICDRCEKTRRVPGAGPFKERWTCCNQPATRGSVSAPRHERKGKAPDVGTVVSTSSFSCVGCARARRVPDGLSDAQLTRCCDVPDAQVCAIVGSARVAAQLLCTGIATQEALAALDTTGDDASDGVRVSRSARVNMDALEEWVAAARGKELDEVMAEILAPGSNKTWTVASVFARLEERAGVSTPADLLAAPVERTLLPVLADLGVVERDTALWRARATARLADAPPWMREAKLEFPAIVADDADGARDSTDEALLRVALDEMETHPDVSSAGEAIRYLYRLSCNVAEFPEEPRFRRLRVDNRAYVNHALGVQGGVLAMEALGWRVSEDGSACVLSASREIGEHTLQTLQDRIKALVAKLAARKAARETES